MPTAASMSVPELLAANARLAARVHELEAIDWTAGMSSGDAQNLARRVNRTLARVFGRGAPEYIRASTTGARAVVDEGKGLLATLLAAIELIHSLLQMRTGSTDVGLSFVTDTPLPLRQPPRATDALFAGSSEILPPIEPAPPSGTTLITPASEVPPPAGSVLLRGSAAVGGTLTAEVTVASPAPAIVISPTIYPAGPGGTVIVANSVTINVESAEFLKFTGFVLKHPLILYNREHTIERLTPRYGFGEAGHEG
jgi:hypothetical protein